MTTPNLPDNAVVTVMDAQCSLCAKGARWIAHNDRKQEFRIVPVQSELGAKLMREHGIDPSDPLSWLYLENGEAHTAFDALIHVGKRLGGVWRLLGVLNILPRRVQDYLYGLVARSRYRLFGRADLCAVPDAEIRKRLLQ